MPFSFYLKEYVDSSGRSQVYLSYNYKGKKYRVKALYAGGDPIKVLVKNFIKKREYDYLRKKGRIKAVDRVQRLIIDDTKQTKIINRRLDELQRRAEDIIFTLQQQTSPTIEKFKAEWELESGRSRVLSILDKYIEEKKARNKSESTIKNLERMSYRLSIYNSDIKFSDFSISFWREYSLYHGGLSINTLILDQNNIKAFLAWGLEIYHRNYAFQKWESSKRISRQIYLSKEELIKIEEFKDFEWQGDEGVRDAFVFMCHTGMRSGEYKSLTPESMKGGILSYRSLKKGVGRDGNKVIITNEIKLSPTLKGIWNKYNGDLPKYSLPHINRRIKSICTKLKIDKNISTSVARHTFTSLSEEMNIDLEVVSNNLGHSSTNTTKIYQHTRRVNEGSVLFDERLRG